MYHLALAGLLGISHPVLAPIFADPATPEAVGSFLTCLTHHLLIMSVIWYNFQLIYCKSCVVHLKCSCFSSAYCPTSVLRILLRIELLSFCFLTTLDKQPCMQASFNERHHTHLRKWWPKILTKICSYACFL